MTTPALTPATEEMKELVRLCRSGRLYDLQRWIEGGKTFEGLVSKRKTLLQIAVETGFHSLVELIVKHDSSQSSKDAALADAVSLKRLDFVELLIENGARIDAIPFADVLLTWDPTLIRFFLEHGADPIKDNPFAIAFGAKVRTALRPFLEFKEAHPEGADAMQEQANIALRHFCSKGELKWISLMLWAGADARSMGPNLEDEYTNDPECYTSGMEQASYAGNVDVLKKLKPRAERDNLEKLLHATAISGRKMLSDICWRSGRKLTTRKTVALRR
jgi:hypothetical protein